MAMLKQFRDVRCWLSRHLNGGAETGTRTGRRSRRLLELEQLENRLTPSNSPIYVTSTADEGDVQNPTAGTLRWAIKKANTDQGEDVIRFAIGTGTHEIRIKDIPLPKITDRVTIDGSWELFQDWGQKIHLRRLGPFDANKANPTDFDGLHFSAGSDGSKVRGLMIDFFEEDAIEIHQAANITIGGTGSREGNTIVGSKFGIFISTPEAHHNEILGNFIGTNSASEPQWSNSSDGIFISGGSWGNKIGDGTKAGRNIISNNDGAGIFIHNANQNTILGNYIGTNVLGDKRLGNVDGIVIDGNSTANVIGGVVDLKTGSANLISGNSGWGIALKPNPITAYPTHTKIEGNFIGVDAEGKKDLKNGLDGIHLAYARFVTIGSSKGGGEKYAPAESRP